MRREKTAQSTRPASLVSTTRTSAKYRKTRKAIAALEKQVRENRKKTMELEKLMASVHAQDAAPASLLEEETAGTEKENVFRKLMDKLDKLNKTALTSACNAFIQDSVNKFITVGKGRNLHVYKTGKEGEMGGNLVVGEGHTYHSTCSNSFVAGFTNKCNGDSQAALGGINGVVGHNVPGESNMGAVLMGGTANQVLKNYGSIVGGYGNELGSEYGAILGGFNGKIKCMSDAFKPVLLGGTELVVEKETWVAPDNPCKGKGLV